MGSVLGCILARFWHPFGSLGYPGDFKWASRGPGRESRGCFGGMLIWGVFVGRFQGHPRILSSGENGSDLRGIRAQLTSNSKVKDTKYRTGYKDAGFYRIQDTGYMTRDW